MKIHSFPKCLLYLALLVSTIPSQARHIIGSDFFYECQGPGNNGNSKRYKLHLDVYRDCSQRENPDFNCNAAFGIYTYSPSRGYIFVNTYNLNYGTKNKVLPNQDACILVPPNLCVETTYYEFIIDLPISNETYVIYYMQCCRNRTILNIPNPGNTGSTFFIEITPESQITCNNSPKFNSFPPIVICANFPLTFDHSAKDKESDSLVYEFCAPVGGGGTQNSGGIPGGIGGGSFCGTNGGCNASSPDPRICPPPFRQLGFVPGFSFQDPLGKGVLNLNNETGLLTGNPQTLGQYVVGVCVNEYRNGILIGSIHRDFQFNVAICEQSVFAKVKSDTVIIDGNRFGITHCGDNEIKFTNESYSEEYIKDYYWEFKPINNPNAAGFTSTLKNPSITFPQPGLYKGVMIVNKNALVCNDTAFIDLNIIPSDIKADFSFTFDKCNASPIKFTNNSSGSITPIKTYNWEYGDTKSSNIRNPIHLYEKPGNYNIKLTVTDGKICKSSITKPLAYFPSPALLDILPDKFRACVPATINFANLSIPLDETYKVKWDFGDGNTAKTLNGTNTYKKPGLYTIKLELEAPSGCITTETFPNFVRIQEGPDADFDYSPKEPNTRDGKVSFLNKSKDSKTFLWDFGDESGSFDINPIHTFRDTGNFVIQLTAKHENGCIDTISKGIRVGQFISYFLPNAFTPNNDGVNDLYFGVGAFIGMQNFNLKIFNRWGEVIFKSDNPTEGWNGKKFNSGPVEPNGVYVCVVSYKDDHGNAHELKGIATLIR